MQHLLNALGGELRAPILPYCGYKVFADYQDPGVDAYRGNPLIEALPAPLSAEEAVRSLVNRIPYAEAERALPTHLRLQALKVATRFFVPLSRHVSLEQDVSAMIRTGYLGRNPVVAGYLAHLHRWAEAIRRGQPDPVMTFRSTAESGAIIGVSGGGKSYSLERVLTLTPQLIHHTEYRGRPFTHRQIVWAKLECPANGSLRSLCQAFFAYVDALCDTPYEERYADPRRSAEQMMPDIARVAGLHSLGLLIIDEIQNLSEAASGGARVMLNFFTELINKLGVPVLLVGTPACRKILGRQFRSARRACGGSAGGVWRPMRADSKDWDRFLKGLWSHQYVRQPTALTDSLRRTLHAETQGITDFAVKLYVVAQIRAMTTGLERVTEAVLSSTAHDLFEIARPLLSALRNSDETALERAGDLEVFDLTHHFQEAALALGEAAAVAAEGENPAPPAAAGIRTPPMTASGVPPAAPSAHLKAPVPAEPSPPTPAPVASVGPAPRARSRTRVKPAAVSGVEFPGSLIALAAEARAAGRSRHDAFLEAGCIQGIETYFAAPAA